MNLGSGNQSSAQFSVCGSNSSSPLANSSYQNPLRAINNLKALRIDQGVDYSGSGPVYAIGDGTVVSVIYGPSSGWENKAWISYRLTNGLAAGDYVYVAENCTPEVTVGQDVNSSVVLCNMVDSFPNIETGWAQPPTSGDIAMAYNQPNKGTATNFGQNFSQLLQLLGAPPGNISLSSSVNSQPLPLGWPTW